MNVKSRSLPDFASGVLITCPAEAIAGIPEWGACMKEVSVSRDDWLRGVIGYCEKHRHLEKLR